jgi:transposase
MNTKNAEQNNAEQFVGIDVSKGTLDVATCPEQGHWTVSNDERGIALLIERLERRSVTLIVLEATGGLQMPVVAALAAADLPVVAVNPRQARDFAKATGKLAKSDSIDAHLLAQFAQAVRPPVRALKDAQTQELQALLGRRRFQAGRQRHPDASAVAGEAPEGPGQEACPGYPGEPRVARAR